jgi:hypothetical protein
MERFNPEVSNNPLVTKADLEKVTLVLLKPLRKLYSPGNALLHIGDTGTIYPEISARMEGFARPLWAGSD